MKKPTYEEIGKIINEVTANSILPKKIKKKRGKAAGLEKLILNMSKSMNSNFKTTREEMRTMLKEMDDKHDSKIEKINERISELDEKIEKSNQDNDKKLNHAIAAMQETVDLVRKDANQKITMMSEIVENLKENSANANFPSIQTTVVHRSPTTQLNQVFVSPGNIL